MASASCRWHTRQAGFTSDLDPVLTHNVRPSAARTASISRGARLPKQILCFFDWKAAVPNEPAGSVRGPWPNKQFLSAQSLAFSFPFRVVIQHSEQLKWLTTTAAIQGFPSYSLLNGLAVIQSCASPFSR